MSEDIQAFPKSGLTNGKTGISFIGDKGMTLRDYFAGQAMQGMMLTGTLGRFYDGGLTAYKAGKCNHVVADRAYVIADAMITQRSKQ